MNKNVKEEKKNKKSNKIFIPILLIVIAIVGYFAYSTYVNKYVNISKLNVNNALKKVERTSTSFYEEENGVIIFEDAKFKLCGEEYCLPVKFVEKETEKTKMVALNFPYLTNELLESIYCELDENLNELDSAQVGFLGINTKSWQSKKIKRSSIIAIERNNYDVDGSINLTLIYMNTLDLVKESFKDMFY